MKPTIGRIVNFSLFQDIDNELVVYPAIVTKVHNATCVNLTAFGIQILGSLNFNDITESALPSHRCWSWPIREADDTKT